MDFPRKRFIEMVKKYVHFRRVKEIQENVQRMKMETNVNERVLLSMKEMEERMMKVDYFRIISPNVRESGKILLVESGILGLESGKQLKESGIPLTKGIQNGKSKWQRLESSAWMPFY